MAQRTGTGRLFDQALKTATLYVALRGWALRFFVSSKDMNQIPAATCELAELFVRRTSPFTLCFTSAVLVI